MNKLVIPSILAATVLIAGIFAFMPVDRAATVHTTIGNKLIIRDVFVNTVYANLNSDPIKVDILVTRHDGTTVTGLTAANFAADIIYGIPNTITVTVDDTPVNGIYRLDLNPTRNWGGDRTNIGITVTSGSNSATALVVIKSACESGSIIGYPLDLTNDERIWLTDNPTIRVAYDPAWFPYEYVNEAGQIDGVTAEYICEFERATGADFVQIPVTSWADSLDALENRRADVLFMVTETQERLAYMGFTTPHNRITTDIVTKDNTPMEITDLQTVATISGYEINDWLAENHPSITITQVGNYEEGIRMLDNDNVEAFLEVFGVVSYHAETIGIEGLYNAGPTGHYYDLSIGYRNDLPVLGSILQKTLDYIPDIKLE